MNILETRESKSENTALILLQKHTFLGTNSHTNNALLLNIAVISGKQRKKDLFEIWEFIEMWWVAPDLKSFTIYFAATTNSWGL